MNEQDDTSKDLAERLVSGHTQIREAAWTELLSTLIPRIERRIRHRLHAAPPRIRQRLDDIRSQTLELLIESLCQSKPVMSVERFALGIADNLCRRALDKDRDREHGRGGSEPGQENDLPALNNPTASIVLQARELRRALRSGLNDFRTTLEKDSTLPRPSSSVRAPVLQLLAIDLAAQGQGKPASLIAATRLEAHTITRLRTAAIEALSEAIRPIIHSHASSALGTTLELAWSDLSPGKPIADHWAEWSIGCAHIDPPFSNAHDSHREDLEAYEQAHVAICRDCQPLQEASSAEIQDWLNLAEESLARSRSR